MTLKKLNRLAHIRLKKGRDQTHEVGAERLNSALPPSHPLPNPLSLFLSLQLAVLCPAPPRLVPLPSDLVFLAGQAESGRLSPAAPEPVV